MIFGRVGRHEYELYFAVEDIDRTPTRTMSPQTNGIGTRFHKTMLDEFYRVVFRKKVYRSIEELQADLDDWTRHCNEARTHQGRGCFGMTPMQTLPGQPPARPPKTAHRRDCMTRGA